MADTPDPREHLDDLPLFASEDHTEAAPSGAPRHSHPDGPEIRLAAAYPGPHTLRLRAPDPHPQATLGPAPSVGRLQAAPDTPPAPWRIPAVDPGPPAPAGPSPTHVPGLRGLDPTPGEETALPSDSASAQLRNGLDWALVNAFRAQASRQLTEALAGETLSSAQQRELGRAIILELLDASAEQEMTAGRLLWTPQQQQQMAEAVFDALFGLGRLQPLVDDDRVENIMITGYDRVILEDSDGQLRQGPPVAESDEELLEFLAFLASRSEANARSFSESQPRLHLRLDGGARLAATAWVTPRPAVVIRRHRLVDVTLTDLVERGTMSPTAASFLAAAVRARKSIVVSGPQSAGKTTLVRALCAEIPPWERIGTFETEYELFLHEMPGRHETVIAYEARPGTGEVGLDGRQAGEITLDSLLVDSFRFNLARQIVGEVRGREILAMIKAMQSGSGSISTTHAGSATGAIRKLITCAMEAGPHITEAYAQRAVAEDIDVIVQLHMDTHPASSTNGTSRATPVRNRWVSDIITVHPGENGPAHTLVFTTDPATPGYARARTLPDEYRQLQQYGFDGGAYAREAEAPWH